MNFLQPRQQRKAAPVHLAVNEVVVFLQGRGGQEVSCFHAHQLPMKFFTRLLNYPIDGIAVLRMVHQQMKALFNHIMKHEVNGLPEFLAVGRHGV